MSLVVSDANIFIDIEVGGLTRAMFQLPEVFAVPNTLYEEELSRHHPDLPIYGLRILEVREEYVREASRLSGIYTRAGRNDLLALALAKQEQCPLLTGDGELRLAAEAERIEVMGTLWLMEQLIVKKLITYQLASKAYLRMREAGRRLPWNDIDEQLERTRKNK